MRGITNLAVQSLLFAPAALAAPGDIRGGEGFTTKIIKARDEKKIWESSGGGNVHVRFSDKQINFGHTKNDVVLTEVRRVCTDIGCGARGETAKVETEYVNDNWALSKTEIEAYATGSFSQNDDEDGSKLDLLVAALIAMDEAEETTEYVYHEAHCSVPSWCEDMAKNSGNDPLLEYWYPAEIQILYETENARAKLDLEFSQSTTEHMGVCEALTNVGGTLSSAMGGIGNGFVLADVICLIADS